MPDRPASPSDRQGPKSVPGPGDGSPRRRQPTRRPGAALLGGLRHPASHRDASVNCRLRVRRVVAVGAVMGITPQAPFAPMKRGRGGATPAPSRPRIPADVPDRRRQKRRLNQPLTRSHHPVTAVPWRPRWAPPAVCFSSCWSCRSSCPTSESIWVTSWRLFSGSTWR